MKRITGWLIAALICGGAEAQEAPSGSGGRGGRPGLLAPTGRLGRVWLVPQGEGPRVPQPSIRAAVVAAAEGDTVLLSDGVFRGPGNRGIYLADKNLIFRSENDASRTMIDCQHQDRALTFAGAAITSDTRIQGITFTRGKAQAGGAIYSIMGSYPTIEDCVFTYCEGSSSGGAVLYQASLVPVFGSIRNCVFLRNTSIEGGAIWGHQVLIDRCYFERNEGSKGGAVRMWIFGSVRNSTFFANGLSFGAGGAIALSGTVTVDHCTIVGNQANIGGGLAFDPDPVNVISNTILWGNTAVFGGAQAWSTVFVGGQNATFDHCLIEAGSLGIGGTGNQIFFGLLEEDPLFLNEAEGDLRLQAGSPAIDAGSPTFLSVVNEGDAENQPRVNEGRTDMGSDEYWDGFTLSLLHPGRAGEVNRLQTVGGVPGALVHFFAGTLAGHLPLGFGACPELELGIEDAFLVGIATANAAGEATLSTATPMSVSGQQFLLQAIDLDLGGARIACAVSNRNSFVLP